MIKTAMIRARVEPGLKKSAETVFQRLGLNATQAIMMFYKQVELRNGLPFDVVVPTPTTKRTFEASEAGRDLIVCEDAEDMYEERGGCGFSFGNGCSSGSSSTNLFGAPARKKLQTPTEVF